MVQVNLAVRWGCGGGRVPFGRRTRSLITQGAVGRNAQPLRPVVAIPSTKYLCRVKNRIKGGTIDSVAIANAPPQLDTAPASPTKVRRARDTLKICGFVRYSRWLKKSSHVHRNVNSAVV